MSDRQDRPTNRPPTRPVAVVTGASSGIGAQTALALARRGWAVVLAARRAERLTEVAEKCRAGGGEAIVQVTDVADASQVERLVQMTVERFGRIDVMLNNAGYGHFGRVHEISERDMRRIFDVNFFGVFHGCKAAAPIMMRQKSGHIFNVSSVIGRRGSPFHGAYCATKFAICGLSDSLRLEMQPYGVKVTCVCPALTATEFFENVRAGQPRSKSDYLNRAKKMPAEKVAERIVRTIGRNKPRIVLTTGAKFLLLLDAVWPRAADRIMKIYHDDLVRALRRVQRAHGSGES